MNSKNAKIIWTMILEAGDYLKNKLPESPYHPKGRNPYAHVALEIKNKFKSSYKDLPDDQYEKIIDFIKFIRENPN